MSIIEQATRRLQELNRAGVGVAWAPSGAVARDERSAAPVAPPATPKAAAWLADAPRADAAAARGEQARAAFEPAVDVYLDLARLEREGYLVPSNARTVLAEEYRQIKRPLLKNARSADAVARRLSLIAVTSARPGEGKTFSAINLAMSIASEIDLSVLLVDADVMRHDAMSRLGVEAELGLMDVLVDEALRLEDAVLRTNVPKLSVLPAGRQQPLSTELMASSMMERLLRRLASEFPRVIIVFDAPPLLATSEAKVLAANVGQVLMVVEAQRTERAAVELAFAALEQCPIVMSVLNKSTGHPKGSYGYGYGYGYGRT
jgi:protein-tyrosine kinase